MQIKTQRYNIAVDEISKGGPSGYESVYLTSEGDNATSELYSLLEQFEGRLLPAEARVIRQRNGSGLVEAIKGDKSLGIASGFKPSGAYHFGHKIASSAVAFFQKNGAQIFIPVADIECEMDTRLSKEAYGYWAADNLLDWGANGINLDAAHVYLQSEEFRVNTLAYYSARGLSFELAADIYGMDKLVSDFPFLFAGITQVGDIILPQHSDFGNFHSFMVSGQDQDGHMKMTVALAEAALNRGTSFLGVQTIPSAFYIPHIRGIQGSKASSSKQEGTLYLGSGPMQESLDERIITNLRKFDSADPLQLERCALDMVRYIDFFNKRSIVNFGEISQDQRYLIYLNALDHTYGNKKIEAQSKLDLHLIDICRSKGQNNVELVRDSLKEALVEHQKKRELVLEYAKAKASYQPQGGWGMDDEKPSQPDFWKVPERAVVDESKRNQTEWQDLVVAMADQLVP